MGPFTRAQRLGVVVSEMLFVLDAERKLQRRPDLAFVSRERWRQRRITSGDAWDIVPDLAIEVVSPSNTAEEIDERFVDYFTAGVEQVWVFYPDTCRVYIHLSLEECRVLDRSGELDGGDILPGFRLSLEKLYETVEEP